MKTTPPPAVLRLLGHRSRPRSGWWRLAWPALLLATSLVAASAALAQDAALNVEVANFTVNEETAQVVINVLDSDGRAIPNLGADQFRVQLDGAETPVTSLSQGVDSSLGIGVVLALDVSASMQGAALQQARDAAQSFLQSLGPEDSVAIVTFANTVDVRLPFTQDKGAVGTAISQLAASPQAGTKLYEATVESVNLAVDSGASRRAVVLLSDGVDYESTLPPDDALAAVEPAGVPVFVIGLGPGVDATYLDSLAQATGGQFAATPSPEGLAQLYQEVGELLRGQYILSLDTGGITPNEAGAASLRVEVTAGESTGVAERAVCFQPTCIALTDIESGAQLEGQRTVNAQVISSEPVSAVTFLVDGKLVEEVTEPPYQFIVDAASLKDGDHTIEARASAAGGGTTSTAVTVRTGDAAGGLLRTSILLAGAVVAIGAAVLVFLLLRFRRREEPPPVRIPWKTGPHDFSAFGPRERADEPAPVAAPSPPKRLTGVLRVVSGLRKGETFAVSDAPASIGSAHRCLIRLGDVLEDGMEIAPEEARVWIRDEQLMVHHVRRLTVTGSVGGTWSIISPGEQFMAGPCTFEFALGEPEALQDAAEPKPPLEPVNIFRTGRVRPREPSGSGGEARPTEGAQADASTVQPDIAPQSDGAAGGPDIFKSPQAGSAPGGDATGAAPASQ